MTNQQELERAYKDTKLSEHFTLWEMGRSDTARQQGIENVPNQREIQNLTILCQHILEPARKQYGKELVISSGFRSEALNKAVGGAKNSLHLQGRAADINVANLRPQDRVTLYDILKSLNPTQLIPEDKHGIVDLQTDDNWWQVRWIHVAC